MIRHYVTLALFALIALGAVSEGDIPEKCLGVVGCLLDSKGMPIITTSDGKEWAVIHDEEQDVPFVSTSPERQKGRVHGCVAARLVKCTAKIA